MQSATSTASTTPAAVLGLAWLAVALPLAWGVSETLAKALVLFQ